MTCVPAPAFPEPRPVETAECRNVLRWIERNVREQPEDKAVVYVFPGQDSVSWTWRRLWNAALSYRHRLSAEGIRAGDVCALILRHDARFVPLYLGVALAGALPAVLAYPNPRLHPDKFQHGLTGMARTSGLDWILTEAALEGEVVPLLDQGIRGVRLPFEWDIDADGNPDVAAARPALDAPPDTPFLLQHSSGTTGLQKAVVLSHGAVIEQVRSYASAIRLSSADRVVSWLPLYHDMGLVAAYLMPLVAGIPQYVLSPFDWVSAPVLFLEAVSNYRGTLAWLPNFAYNHMATKIADEDLEGLRLDSLRLLINCSEPIRRDSHELFKARLAPYGLASSCLAASYAMAENTFAVTQTAVGSEAVSVLLDRAALQQGEVVRCADETRGRWCVSSGAAVEGTRVRIVDEARHDAPPVRVGEIAIRSTCLFSGYRHQPELSQRAIHDGWFLTGDLGFLMDGELFVVGRKKDLIIVGGKNLYPEDIEDVCSRVTGVIPGRVVAFGVENEQLGTESIHVIAETEASEEAGRRQLVLRIRQECLASDFSVSDVHLVPPRWLVKSSAGKLSRNTNRERLIERDQVAL